MSRIAVIDLGSNTFHLLIAEMEAEGIFNTIFRKRVFTGLSDGGIDIIKEDRIKSGLQTLTEFRQILDAHESPELRVIGTAVLRKASNRQIFIDQASEILNTPVEIIDGEKEAHYIYKGIALLPEMQKGCHLVMDIGGGSTEFILVKEGSKIWSRSYTLGVGVLHQLFHKSEPISKEDYHALENYVNDTIVELKEVIIKYAPTTLAGASGSFEVLQSMVGMDANLTGMTIVNPESFYTISEKILTANYAEREKLPGLPKERVKLIVVGMALKKIICNLVNPKQILVSPYALKEGVMSEMLSNK